MEKKLPMWKPIKMGDRLPCDSLLMKKDGTIPSVVSGAGVKVGQDAYYLPVEEIRALPKEKSEDERMIKYFKDLAPFDKAEELYEKYGFSHKDAIAWLEKQGEHKKFLDSIKVGDKVTRNEDGVLVNLSQLNRVAKKEEKQGEQKPIKSLVDSWKEMRLEVWAQASGNRPCNVSDDNTKMFSLNDVDEIIEKIGDCQIEQKSTEWSDEDEKISSAIIKRLSSSDALSVSLQSAICWIENVKDRVQPQPKQEWSEEDDKMLSDIVKELVHPWNEYIPDRIEEEIKWLKNKAQISQTSVTLEAK